MSRRYLRFDDGLEILEEHFVVHQTSNGGFKTNCPAHDDQHPSLLFYEGDDGNFAPKCMAGCTPKQIVEAIHRLNGEVVEGDSRARKMRELLTEKSEWKDADLAFLFEVSVRTIDRWLKDYKQDGLQWTRKSYSKVYDISKWGRDRTSISRSPDMIGQQNKKTNGFFNSNDVDISNHAANFENENAGYKHTSHTIKTNKVSSAPKNVRSYSGPTVDYPYLDSDTGELIAVKRRFINTKAFVWMHPRGKFNRLVSKLPDGMHEKDLPLYGSHKLKRYSAQSHVIIVEGEKAVDALTAFEVPAVCFPGGAGARNLPYLPDYHRKCWRAILWPDNDVQGRACMWKAAKHVYPSVTQLMLLDPPHMPEHGDAYDFIDAGRTLEELRSLVACAQTLRLRCGGGSFCINEACGALHIEEAKEWEREMERRREQARKRVREREARERATTNP